MGYCEYVWKVYDQEADSSDTPIDHVWIEDHQINMKTPETYRDKNVGSVNALLIANSDTIIMTVPDVEFLVFEPDCKDMKLIE